MWSEDFPHLFITGRSVLPFSGRLIEKVGRVVSGWHVPNWWEAIPARNATHVGLSV